MEKSASNEELPTTESNQENLEGKEELRKFTEELDKINKMTNTFDIFFKDKDNGSMSRSFEDIHSDSGIVGSVELEVDQSRFNEINNDIEEYSKKNEMHSLEEHREQISEITINFGIELDDGENITQDISEGKLRTTNIISKEPSSENVFINTYEVDKQIIFTLNCEDAVINTCEIKDDCSAVVHHTPVELLSSNNIENESEEREYCQESNTIYVNTYEIKNDKVDV